LEGYLQPHPFFGVLVGRYGNRIAQGRFSIGEHSYQLACNNGANHLHGGLYGFDKRHWAAMPGEHAGQPSLLLSYVSVDGEDGYPGNLDVQVRYTLTDANALQIDYAATTDQATILNLTNHSYFNLAGRGTIHDHLLQLLASHFLPVDPGLIPLGQLAPVQGTPMDFLVPTPVGAGIDAEDEQLQRGQGYDHTWVLDGPTGALNLAARVFEPTSGRVLEVLTTQPGVQFYAGNQLDGSVIGKASVAYQRRSGLCLETQHFPDSPNQPSFPSTLLRPGETYRHTTVYRMLVAD